MGFIIFLLLLGAVCFFILIAGLALSLFSAIFGYDRDPYEDELARMYYEDAILDKLDDINGGEQHLHITDARQIHLHQHR